jgi:hypothetical protein
MWRNKITIIKPLVTKHILQDAVLYQFLKSSFVISSFQQIAKIAACVGLWPGVMLCEEEKLVSSDLNTIDSYSH